jgi:phosphoribosyl-AMP cyclohydrolase
MKIRQYTNLRTLIIAVLFIFIDSTSFCHFFTSENSKIAISEVATVSNNCTAFVVGPCLEWFVLVLNRSSALTFQKFEGLSSFFIQSKLLRSFWAQNQRNWSKIRKSGNFREFIRIRLEARGAILILVIRTQNPFQENAAHQKTLICEAFAYGSYLRQHLALWRIFGAEKRKKKVEMKKTKYAAMISMSELAIYQNIIFWVVFPFKCAEF